MAGQRHVCPPDELIGNLYILLLPFSADRWHRWRTSVDVAAAATADVAMLHLTMLLMYEVDKMLWMFPNAVVFMIAHQGICFVCDLPPLFAIF